MLDLINKICDKVFSARFIITIFIGITYCKMVHHCVYYFLESMKNDPTRLEAFVTGLIMGFSSIAMFVIKSYFDRTDRDTPVSVAIASPEPLKTQITPIVEPTKEEK